MEEKNKGPFEGIFKALAGMVKVLVFLLLVQIYWEAWIKFYREKQWLYFILMSIIPALMLYCLGWEVLVGGTPPGFDNPYMDYDD
ncbi:MAG: hypothetical protein IPG89_08345 [Bacteroidetes bacterium]|nr:hypothetical protein [Bacteroidota bacterium]